MAFPPAKPNHLEREFLPIRAKILEIASALDRIQRYDQHIKNQSESDSQRWQQLQAGIRLLLEEGTQQRAEQVQLLFSRSYDEQWRETMDVPG